MLYDVNIKPKPLSDRAVIFKINRTYTVIIFFIFPLVLLKSANQLTHSYTGTTLVAITVLWFCYKTGFFFSSDTSQRNASPLLLCPELRTELVTKGNPGKVKHH